MYEEARTLKGIITTVLILMRKMGYLEQKYVKEIDEMITTKIRISIRNAELDNDPPKQISDPNKELGDDVINSYTGVKQK